MNVVFIGTPYDLVFIDLSQQAGFTFLIFTPVSGDDTGIDNGEIIDFAYQKNR